VTTSTDRCGLRLPMARKPDFINVLTPRRRSLKLRADAFWGESQQPSPYFCCGPYRTGTYRVRARWRRIHVNWGNPLDRPCSPGLPAIPVQLLSERLARHLKCRGLLMRETERSYLALEPDVVWNRSDGWIGLRSNSSHGRANEHWKCVDTSPTQGVVGSMKISKRLLSFLFHGGTFHLS